MERGAPVMPGPLPMRSLPQKKYLHRADAGAAEAWSAEKRAADANAQRADFSAAPVLFRNAAA